MSALLTIDGSQGEGGGQVFRSSLALSMITGRAVRLTRIRAGRRKPGLLRQHLTALRAATAVCGAEVEGAELGSGEVLFRPGSLRAGSHRFAVGSAGSANLVLQTVLPALLQLDGPSTVEVQGGTHNPMSPTADCLQHSFLPLLSRHGAEVGLELLDWGFHPAGGGTVRATVRPGPLRPALALHERGPVSLTATAVVCNISQSIGSRELNRLGNRIPLDRQTVQRVHGPGPGNVLTVTATMPTHREVFVAFGARGRRAEQVADQLAEEVRAWLAAEVPVGPHLADQLLLPMALAGGGSFHTVEPTGHTRTNIDVIETFLPVRFTVSELGRGRWGLAVQPR